jgi:hypothetical protein
MKPAITHLVSEILTHNIIMEPKKQLTADTNDRQLDRRGRSWPVARQNFPTLSIISYCPKRPPFNLYDSLFVNWA